MAKHRVKHETKKAHVKKHGGRRKHHSKKMVIK